MKILALILVMCLFSGCSGTTSELERGMELRSKILKAEAVEFETDITADYGDKLHCFSLKCRGTSDGTIAFTVTQSLGVNALLAEYLQGTPRN